MTGSAEDGPEWQKHIGNKKQRRDLANQFKDAKNPFKIVIVRDMWREQMSNDASSELRISNGRALFTSTLALQHSHCPHPRRTEHMLEQEDGKKRWMQVVTELSRSF